LASSRKKPTKKAAKPRKQKTVTNDETCLQKHAWQWVQKTHPALLIFHVANERKGSIGTAMHFKRMGVLAGVADFLAFPVGRAVAIELKDDEGTHKTGQAAFQDRWEDAGNTYFIARTLEEFQGIIAAITLF
jgi:hypothetical protein